MNTDYLKRFEPQKYTIKTFDYWTIILRKRQITIGAAIICLNREVASFALVEPREFAELSRVFQWYEHVVKKLYKASKFNYIAAMMKDEFVHFHAFPRYKEPIFLCGATYKDIYWPDAIHLDQIDTNEQLLNSIYSAFKSFV